MPAHAPRLLLPKAYIKDATRRIEKSKTRVSLVSLILSDDTITKPLIDALCKAAKRGVDVQVAADSFTYGELAGHLVPTRYFSKRTRQTNSMVRRLRKHGVKFHWLGTLAQTPVSGRTHLKWVVVDNTVFSFGGVNMYQDSIKFNDYMFRFDDRPIADELVREFKQLIKANRGRFSFKSHQVASSLGTILIDGGLPLDSIIYRRAKSLAANSSSIVLVSQYAPTGGLARQIRKVPHRLYFNRISQADRINRVILSFIRIFSNINTSYTKDQYLHAKYILFYRDDAPTIALTGSHNFVRGGTIVGTREIALETSDKNIIAQLEKFTDRHVAN